MAKLVTTTLADSPLTPAQKRQLAKMANLPDEAIDLTEIPEFTPDFFKNAIKNPYCRPGSQARVPDALKAKIKP
jgi:hypothetical protein